MGGGGLGNGSVVGEGRCSKCPSLQDAKPFGDGTHSATLGRLWFRPLGGASLRIREKAPGEKPLISDLSFNLLVKKWSHLRLLLYSSKISTMTMNLTPKASLGMARYPPQGLAGEGLQGFS